MNCSDLTERIPALASGLLPADEREACLAHVAACDGCADALRGGEAMQFLRRRDAAAAPEGLFQRVLDEVSGREEADIAGRRFWLGTAVGGAIAASLLAVVMMLGVLVRPVDVAPQLAEFYVSAEEPRIMHVAIETEQALPGGARLIGPRTSMPASTSCPCRCWRAAMAAGRCSSGSGTPIANRYS